MPNLHDLPTLLIIEDDCDKRISLSQLVRPSFDSWLQGDKARCAVFQNQEGWQIVATSEMARKLSNRWASRQREHEIAIAIRELGSSELIAYTGTERGLYVSKDGTVWCDRLIVSGVPHRLYTTVLAKFIEHGVTPASLNSRLNEFFEQHDVVCLFSSPLRWDIHRKLSDTIGKITDDVSPRTRIARLDREMNLNSRFEYDKRIIETFTRGPVTDELFAALGFKREVWDVEGYSRSLDKLPPAAYGAIRKTASATKNV